MACSTLSPLSGRISGHPREARFPSGEQTPEPEGLPIHLLPARPRPRPPPHGGQLRRQPVTFKMVDDEDSLLSLQKTLAGVNNSIEPATVFISMEGTPVSRNGGISIMMMSFLDEGPMYAVDVFTLGRAAFTLEGDESGRRSLQSLLEDAEIVKFFWDIRGPADALHWLYQVNLAGAVDLQLVEAATRKSTNRDPPRPHESLHPLRSLVQAIETQDIWFSPEQRASVSDNYAPAIRLFWPDVGGSYEVFNERPMDHTI